MDTPTNDTPVAADTPEQDTVSADTGAQNPSAAIKDVPKQEVRLTPDLIRELDTMLYKNGLGQTLAYLASRRNPKYQLLDTTVCTELLKKGVASGAVAIATENGSRAEVLLGELRRLPSKAFLELSVLAREVVAELHVKIGSAASGSAISGNAKR